MEDSASTSMNKALFSHEGYSSSASSEESGWTTYFEDLFALSEKRKDGHDEDKCISISEGGSSLLSDAASNCFNAVESGKKLSLYKKRKTGIVLDDDPFEDTASSPLTSQKVNEMDILNMKQRKKDENKHISQDKDDNSENFTEEKKNVDRVNECTELKKRGLCLVPLPMLVDYLG